MYQMTQVFKSFDQQNALSDINLSLPKGSIAGLIGSNGSGKSTLLRLLAGVYRADSGRITYNEKDIFDNPAAKKHAFFISDDPYVPAGGNMLDLAQFYQEYYPQYDHNRFLTAAEAFELDPKRKLSTFSKGMQRQAHIILAIAAGTDYLFCDETFDGLDPVKRQAVKRILADLVAEGKRTVFIASHNLRELEDICDRIAFLHQGKLVLDRSIDELSDSLHHVQAAFSDKLSDSDLEKLAPLYVERRGRMIRLICRGQREAILAALAQYHPLYLESLPLTLEEVFITEMEVHGYDVNKLIF